MRPRSTSRRSCSRIAVVAVSFFVSLKAMDWLSPRRQPSRAGAGRIAAAAAGAAQFQHHRAGRDCAVGASATPPIAARRTTSPARPTIRSSQILQNADIGWTASRGPITATGAQDVLSLATPLTGTLNVTGSLSAKATGAVGDALGGLLGGNVAKQIGSVNIKNAQRQRRDQGQRRRSPRGRNSPRPGASSRIWPRRSISATPAFRWRAPASTCRRRSSR